MSENLKLPPTEVELAEAMLVIDRACAGYRGAVEVIRRLAFERDRLRDELVYAKARVLGDIQHTISKIGLTWSGGPTAREPHRQYVGELLGLKFFVWPTLVTTPHKIQYQIRFPNNNRMFMPTSREAMDYCDDRLREMLRIQLVPQIVNSVAEPGGWWTLAQACSSLMFYYEAFREKTPQGPTEQEDIAGIRKFLTSMGVVNTFGKREHDGDSDGGSGSSGPTEVVDPV